MDARDQELELWRSATEVPDAAVALLRSRVLAAVGQPKPRFVPWKWAAAGVVTAGLAGFWVSRPAAEIQSQPAPQPAIVTAPIAEPLPAPSLKAPLVTHRRKPESVQLVAQAASYIRMETEDPDVVILLVSGGGE